MKTNRDSEKWIEKTLTKNVEKAGGMCIKLLPLLLSGLPDRMILLPGGRIHFVETKSRGDGPSKIQKVIHARFLKLGFHVHLVTNEEILNEFINTYIL